MRYDIIHHRNVEKVNSQNMDIQFWLSSLNSSINL